VAAEHNAINGAYEDKSWYDPIGLYQAGGNELYGIFATYSRAKEMVADDQYQRQLAKTKSIYELLRQPLLLSSDTEIRTKAEAQVASKLTGDGQGQTDYLKQLKDQIISIDGQIKTSTSYVSGLDKSDPSVKRMMSQIEQAKAYKGSCRTASNDTGP